MSKPPTSRNLRATLIDGLLKGWSVTPALWYELTYSHNLPQRVLDARKYFGGLGVTVENLGVGGLRTHSSIHAVYRIPPDQLALARQLTGFSGK